ncbi:hypothetical protein SCHPADRAFT_337531 [Schizopora paradoxa]|uniref:Uncharacterized protein n=1 Tax=Schizopora paradoxa TaxID=27342 RepID=A0A0H2RQV4_9AGAM|nr:hypothetical protein SCHPADRAFT_337531 [Schizopora paradoxa]
MSFRSSLGTRAMFMRSSRPYSGTMRSTLSQNTVSLTPLPLPCTSPLPLRPSPFSCFFSIPHRYLLLLPPPFTSLHVSPHPDTTAPASPVHPPRSPPSPPHPISQPPAHSPNLSPSRIFSPPLSSGPITSHLPTSRRHALLPSPSHSDPSSSNFRFGWPFVIIFPRVRPTFSSWLGERCDLVLDGVLVACGKLSAILLSVSLELRIFWIPKRPKKCSSDYFRLQIRRSPPAPQDFLGEFLRLQGEDTNFSAILLDSWRSHSSISDRSFGALLLAGRETLHDAPTSFPPRRRF